MSNKMMSSLFIAILLTGIMAMNSCIKNSPVATISFSKDIIPIFITSCAISGSCHLGANSTNDNLTLDSAGAYASIMAKNLVSTSNPGSSLLFVEVSTGVMPKYPYTKLSSSQQNIILQWITQGAKNN